MNKVIVALLLVAGFLALKKCAPSQAKDVTFSGTWSMTQENGISGAISSSTATVQSDKKRFKIVTVSEDLEQTQIYDGDTLHEKYVYHAPASEGSQTFAPIEPRTESRKASELDVAPLRFWAGSYPGKAGAGGQIAGREALLYQARENRPDGELTVQAWADAKTGIILKAVHTVYSSQINAMVTKNSFECQSINYGPVDASSFNKP